MADVVDVCSRQREVTELFIAQGSNWICIQRHLRSVYGEDAIDVSSVSLLSFGAESFVFQVAIQKFKD